jgi:O-antigen/teichoic acid export membrane protein
MPTSSSSFAARIASHLRTPLYRNAYALMASNLLTSSLGVAYWAVAARLYSTETVGQNAALISTLLLVTAVSQLNLRVALNRFLPEAGSSSRRFVALSYAASVTVTSVVSGGVAVAVLFIGTPELVPTGPTIAIALGFVGAAVAWTLFNIQDGVLTGLRRAVWVPLENGLYAVAKIIVLAALALSFPRYGIFASFFVPMAAAVTVVSFVLFRWWLPEHQRLTQGRQLPMGARDLIGFLSADYLASLFGQVYLTMLPVLVGVIAGSGPAAYFYAVWTIATSLQLVPVYMAASLTAETVAHGTDVTVGTRRALIHTLRIVVPMAIVVVVVAPYLLEIFGPRYASEGTSLLRVLAIAIVPQSVAIIFVARERIHARAREIVAVQSTMAVTILTASYVLLNVIGITGIGVAWTTAWTVLALVLLTTQFRAELTTSAAVMPRR